MYNIEYFDSCQRECGLHMKTLVVPMEVSNSAIHLYKEKRPPVRNAQLEDYPNSFLKDLIDHLIIHQMILDDLEYRDHQQ